MSSAKLTNLYLSCPQKMKIQVTKIISERWNNTIDFTEIKQIIKDIMNNYMPSKLDNIWNGQVLRKT